MRSTRGIILPVVLLVSAIALLTFLFSSAVLSVAGRGASAQERASTQALLAADSGLNTLRARSTTVPYAVSEGTFTDWIEKNFATLDLGDNVQANIDVLTQTPPTGTPTSITVQSTGTVGTSQRVIVQEFEIVVGPPVPASVNVPGALTSVDTIKSSSGATRVVGRGDTEGEWTYTNVPACNAYQGEYVQYEAVWYRVASASDCEGPMDLEAVIGNGSATIDGGTTVSAHRPTAVTSPVTSATGDPPVSTVEVTSATATLFGVGASITIGNGSGTVTSIDGDTLTIEWDDEPTYPVGEGTVVRRHVLSGVTQGDCNLNKDYTFPNDCREDADLTNLFYKTFGVSSPNFLYESLPESQKLSGSELRDAGRVLSDVTWVKSPENNVRGQTGSGILIIENDPDQTITLNVDNSFTGLIYVIGNADIQGNAQYPGAIIVDGEADVTNVQGTADINFDPLTLMRALADIDFPNPDPGSLGQPIANTWRIR